MGESVQILSGLEGDKHLGEIERDEKVLFAAFFPKRLRHFLQGGLHMSLLRETACGKGAFTARSSPLCMQLAASLGDSE